MAQITRKLSRVNIFSVRNYEHLLSGEKLSNTNFNLLSKMNELEMQDIIDARTQIVRSHVFEPRYRLDVKNALWDVKTGMGFSLKTKNGIKETSSWTIGNLQNTAVPIAPRAPFMNGEFFLLPSNGFYHWLIEDLPTFLPLLPSRHETKILVWEYAPKYVIDFLRLAMIPHVLVGRFVRVESLGVISKNEDSGWSSKQDVGTLRSFFMNGFKDQEEFRKIYISRISSTRTQIWESELQNLLRNDGWTVIELQDFSLESQIKLISSAGILAGLHGAGLSHMVWMNPNSRVIELGGSGYRSCYTSLAQACGHQYARIQFSDTCELGQIASIANELKSTISNFASKD